MVLIKNKFTIKLPDTLIKWDFSMEAGIQLAIVYPSYLPFK